MLNTIDLIFGASSLSCIKYVTGSGTAAQAPPAKGGGADTAQDDGNGKLAPLSSPQTMGVLQLDMLTSETYILPSLATQYPVEQGMPISDGIIPQSPTLKIVGSISSANATLFQPWGVGLLGIQRLDDAVKLMESLQQSHKPVTVVTGLHVYDNMAMTSCQIDRGVGAAGRVLTVTASFLRIRTVQPATADGNPSGEVSGKTGQTAAPAGKAQAADPPDSVVSSVMSVFGLA